jgi:hypothetical protein
VSVALEARRALTTMHLVAQYRQFATDYRRLAEKLTKPTDKQALELLALVWDRTAENREAMLRKLRLVGIDQTVGDDAPGGKS